MEHRITSEEITAVWESLGGYEAFCKTMGYETFARKLLDMLVLPPVIIGDDRTQEQIQEWNGLMNNATAGASAPTLMCLDMAKPGYEQTAVVSYRPAYVVSVFELWETNGIVRYVGFMHENGLQGIDAMLQGYQFCSDTIKGRAEYEAECLRYFLGQREVPPSPTDYDTDTATEPETHLSADMVAAARRYFNLRNKTTGVSYSIEHDGNEGASTYVTGLELDKLADSLEHL